MLSIPTYMTLLEPMESPDLSKGNRTQSTVTPPTSEQLVMTRRTEYFTVQQRGQLCPVSVSPIIVTTRGLNVISSFFVPNPKTHDPANRITRYCCKCDAAGPLGVGKPASGIGTQRLAGSDVAIHVRTTFPNSCTHLVPPLALRQRQQCVCKTTAHVGRLLCT